MPRSSILNNYEAVKNAVEDSTSIKEALNILGLRAAGGNYKKFREACELHGLTVPQFDYTSQASTLHALNSFPDDQVFTENSTYHNRARLKRKLFASGIKNECVECGQGPVWNGKPLTLQLDHINGIWNDNRKENLRILCGHCHSQTETFCGRSKPKTKKIPKPRPTKIDWPDTETLIAMVKSSSYTAVGKKLGVSDVAVRKHLSR